MHASAPSYFLSFPAYSLIKMAGTAVCVGLASTAGPGIALGQQAIWVARGTTEHVRRVQNLISDAPTGSNFVVITAANDVYANWMVPNIPGGTSGRSAQVDQVDSLEHAVIADDLHASRRIIWETGTLGSFQTGPAPEFKSLTITTRGNLNIAGDGSYGPTEWFVRNPQATGTHVFTNSRFTAGNAWIGGTGALMLESSRLNSSGMLTPFVKSGPGTLIINPLPGTYSGGAINVAWSTPVRVYDGTVAFWGTGEQFLLFGDGSEAITIGSEANGVDYPPSSIPPASWAPFNIPPVPPLRNPRVLIQADNVVWPYTWVRMGFNSVLQFEAPEPITFLGVAASTAPRNGTVVVKAEPSEAVSFNESMFDYFSGDLRVERGIARLKFFGTTNAGIRYILAAASQPQDAVLELNVPETRTGYLLGQTLSGSGRLLKTGPGELSFNAATGGFTGDFVVASGEMRLPPDALSGSLRNSVSVTGSTSVLNQQADGAVADTAAVSLDSGGMWRMNGRADTIGRIKLGGGSRLELGGGTLTLGGGVLEFVNTPGGMTAATVAGPGTLASTVPLAVESADSLAPIDLDIQATLAAPSVLFSGLGTVRLAGSGAAGPAVTVQSGAVRLARTGVNAATGAVTIGDAGSGLPFAPDASVVLGASDQLPDNKAVAMNVRGSLDLNGFTDTIGGLAVNGAGPFNVTAGTGELVLAGDASFVGTGTTTLSGPLNMLAGSRNFVVYPGATALLTGTAYSGTINKIGSGTLRLDNLDGYFTLNNGGSTTSAGTASVGGVTGSGTIQIDTALTINVPAASQRGYGGAFSGAGMLIKSGAGMQELNAGVANTHTGGTRVEGGTLFLNRFPGTTVIPGNITVASGGTLLFAGGASNQIADTANVSVDGVMDLAGQSETVRTLSIGGSVTIDGPAGTPGSLTATQSIAVFGGTLTGTVGGGSLTLNPGSARVRGTLASASLGSPAFAGTLSVGGFSGSNQLTINGAMSLPSANSTLQFTTDRATDPALIRARGELTYPSSGAVRVRVDQFVPQPIGSAIKLIDFGTGPSTPQLAKYALVAPVAGSGRGVLTLSNRVLSYVVTRNPCPADANGSGTVSVQDIFDYLTAYFANSPGADFNGSGSVTVQDIFDFLAAYFAGCA